MALYLGDSCVATTTMRPHELRWVVVIDTCLIDDGDVFSTDSDLILSERIAEVVAHFLQEYKSKLDIWEKLLFKNLYNVTKVTPSACRCSLREAMSANKTLQQTEQRVDCAWLCCVGELEREERGAE